MREWGYGKRKMQIAKNNSIQSNKQSFGQLQKPVEKAAIKLTGKLSDADKPKIICPLMDFCGGVYNKPIINLRPFLGGLEYRQVDINPLPEVFERYI